MKAAFAGLAVAVLIGGSALPQSARPAADPLTVKPIPSQAQIVDADVIRTKIEQAGYTDVSDVSRDSTGVWRARARKGSEAFTLVVDKGGRIKPGAR